MTKLEELKAIAKAATPGKWEALDSHSSITDGYLRRVCELHCTTQVYAKDHVDICMEDGNAIHIATFNPQTVLALLEIIELCEGGMNKMKDNLCDSLSDGTCDQMWYQDVIEETQAEVKKKLESL